MQAGGTPRAGRRIGNIRVPVGRRRSVVFDVPQPSRHRPARPGTLYLVAGFLILIAAGTALLLLPFATESGQQAPVTTALFTSTSAVCVTGLVVVDTRSYWSPFGEAVILLLIQLGGLGFMTSSTLLLVLVGRRLSLGQRLLAGQTLGTEGTQRIGLLVRRIVLWTLAIEAIGALVLVVAFAAVPERSFGLATIWAGVFTAVSSFNNAGFDVEGGGRSLLPYSDAPLVLAPVMVLVVLGGLGYAIWADVTTNRRWRRLTLNTKIVLLTSVALWLFGAVLFLILESRVGGVFGDDALPARLLDSLFMSVNARTAGFTSVNMAALSDSTLFVLMGLIFIGGASASTAGGIKLNTFTTLFFAILASLRGEERVNAFGREIPARQVNRALSVALLAIAVVFAVTLGAAMTTEAPFIETLFEAFSAFGTDGLSTGVTPLLDTWGRLVIVAAMFVGRLGPLTIALALAGRVRPTRLRYPEEEVSIG